MTQPLSVQLYTVRDALSADLPGTLQRIASIGYTNVEAFGYVENADELRDALAMAEGVEVHHSSIAALLSRLGFTYKKNRWWPANGAAQG